MSAPNCAQRLFLSLCSGVTISGAQRTISSAREQTSDCCSSPSAILLVHFLDTNGAMPWKYVNGLEKDTCTIRFMQLFIVEF